MLRKRMRPFAAGLALAAVLLMAAMPAAASPEGRQEGAVLERIWQWMQSMWEQSIWEHNGGCIDPNGQPCPVQNNVGRTLPRLGEEEGAGRESRRRG